MKKLMLAIFVCNTLLFISCNKDISTAELTFVKATAIYGDLSDQRQTPLKGELQDLVDPGKIYVSQDLLLIGEEGRGIHMYDNTDPENPTPLSFIEIPENKEFYVNGNTIYAESLYDMLKIDITDRKNPNLEKRIENAFATPSLNDKGEAIIGFEFQEVTEELTEDSDFWQLAFNQQTVYLDYKNRIIPSSAVPSSFAGSSGSSIGTVNRIALKDDYVYVISSEFMSVFKDGQGFELVSTQQVGWQMETIYPQDDALFVGTRNSMQIFDITNPEQPIDIGWFSHATACDPVLPVGDIAYVTLRTGDEAECPGDENALVVVNTSNLNSPFQVQSINMVSPFGMTLIGNNLFVGEGENGLKIFDATDRSNLVEIKYDTSVKAYDIIAHPFKSNLILIASPNGFGQYEVDNTNDNLSLLSWISH